MIRSASIALALIALLAGATPASAQDPLPPAHPEGPLVPTEFAAPPQNAPGGPLGEYPRGLGEMRSRHRRPRSSIRASAIRYATPPGAFG